MDEVTTPGGAAALDTHDGHHHDDHHGHHDEGFLTKYLWSTDHKMICFQYLFTGMIMAAIGGYMAYAFRMQLAYLGACTLFGLVSAAEYNALVTVWDRDDFLGNACPYRSVRELSHPLNDRVR